MRPVVLCLAALAAACGPPPPTTGTALLKFAVSDMVKTSANLKSPLLGTTYGNLFLSEDVSLSGPRKGSTEFGLVKLENVDLRTAAVSAEEVVSAALPPGLYTYLGMLDVNGNGDDPDAGDPVTLPFTNKFEITAGQQTKRLILFELVFN